MYGGTRLSGYRYNGSDSNIGLWARLGAFGVIGSIVAAVAIYNIGQYNDKAVQLDTQPSVVFNDVAQCVKAGYDRAACRESFKSALLISQGTGTTLYYAWSSSCTAEHVSCNAKTDCTTTDNDDGTSDTSCSTYYYPPVVAWQAKKDDLSISLPLYRTLEEGVYVRKDKKIVESVPVLSGPEY